MFDVAEPDRASPVSVDNCSEPKSSIPTARPVVSLPSSVRARTFWPIVEEMGSHA